MKWNCGCPTVGMSELLVRSSLTNFYEIQRRENRHYFPRFQNRNSHGLTYLDRFHTHELGFIYRLAVFKKHGDDLVHIRTQLVQ